MSALNYPDRALSNLAAARTGADLWIHRFRDEGKQCEVNELSLPDQTGNRQVIARYELSDREAFELLGRNDDSLLRRQVEIVERMLNDTRPLWEKE